MEFEKLTNYIEDIYRDYGMTSTDEFVGATGMKDFCPVIQTETARLLMLLLRAKRPEKVLEIGTSIGYSAASMARVVKEWGGRIITIEFDEKVADQARKNFESAGVSGVIEVLIGDALELVPRMKERYDFIFLDPFNDIYHRLLEDCVNLLNRGGMLVADDTLFPVLKREGLDSPLHEYNKRVARNADLESTILPVGDGVTIAVKK
jgi:predicted O-methyltransferase YrrM